ncbi:hypothetical protein ACLOJK_013264, partial [Asimina triloba]
GRWVAGFNGVMAPLKKHDLGLLTGQPGGRCRIYDRRHDRRRSCQSLKMMDAVDQTARKKDAAADFSTIHASPESDLKKQLS